MEETKGKETLKAHITKVINFCIVLISLTRKQRIAILHELDKKQLAFIREISLNILINKNLSLSDKEKAYFNHNLRKLRTLGSHTASRDAKVKIISKNQQLLKKIANVSVKYLRKEQ